MQNHIHIGREINHVVNLDPLIGPADGIADGFQFRSDTATLTLNHCFGNDIGVGLREVDFDVLFQFSHFGAARFAQVDIHFNGHGIFIPCCHLDLSVLVLNLKGRLK